MSRYCMTGGNDTVWRDYNHCGDERDHGGDVCHAVVVLSPDDREQARVLALRYNTASGDTGTDKMQAALRSLTTPPKPEEPTDPAARVSDRRDNIWRLLADGDWVCTSGPDIGEYLVWERLAADRGPLGVDR